MDASPSAPVSSEHPYPGSSSTPDELLALANTYRLAASALLPLGAKGNPISRAPARLCAIHAIELYLNVFLLSRGVSPARIRGLQHDFRARTDASMVAGLVLRKRTVAHLHRLSEGREYLVTRYGPELSTSLSQLNRLMATLDEVARKVTPPPP